MWFYGLNIPLAIVLAATSLLLDLFWYSQLAFASYWRALTGRDLHHNTKSYLDFLLGKCLFHFSTAVALTYLLGQMIDYGQAFLFGLVLGLAILSSGLGIHYQQLRLAPQQWFIDGAFQTLRCVIMCLLIGLWNNIWS